MYIFARRPPNQRTVIIIQLALRTAPYYGKTFHLQYYLFSTVIHIQPVRSQICVHRYIYTYSTQHSDTDRAKELKNATAVNVVCRGNVSTCNRFASTAITFWV